MAQDGIGLKCPDFDVCRNCLPRFELSQHGREHDLVPIRQPGDVRVLSVSLGSSNLDFWQHFPHPSPSSCRNGRLLILV